MAEPDIACGSPPAGIRRRQQPLTGTNSNRFALNGPFRSGILTQAEEANVNQ